MKQLAPSLWRNDAASDISARDKYLTQTQSTCRSLHPSAAKQPSWSAFSKPYTNCVNERMGNYDAQKAIESLAAQEKGKTQNEQAILQAQTQQLAAQTQNVAAQAELASISTDQIKIGLGVLILIGASFFAYKMFFGTKPEATPPKA